MLNVHGPFDVIPSCHLWISEDDRGVCPEQSDEAATSIMDARDRQRWQRFRPAEKKHQFLSSRLAVRNVLDHEFRSSEAKAHFTADDSGRPMVTSTDGKELCRISLSHSSSVTAVAIVHGTTKVGVDIETFGDTRAGTSSSLGISPDEVDHLHHMTGMNTAFCTTAVWTIKEAVWKAFDGVNFLLPSQIGFEQDTAGMLSWHVQTGTTKEQGPLIFFIPPNSPMFTGPEEMVLRLPTRFQTPFLGSVALRLSTDVASHTN
jgi:phosphopantetheinyl transferase